MRKYAASVVPLVATVALICLAQVPLQAQTSTPTTQNSCVKCHTEVGDELAVPIKEVANDVHGRRGFSCASCHGGDPADDDHDRAMDPKKGFIGTPAPKQV